MLDYNIIQTLTLPIFVFSIYKLFNVFFVEDTYSEKYEFISYILFFVVSLALIYITQIPIIMLLITIISFFIISLNYKASTKKRILVVSLIYCILITIELTISIATGFMGVSVFENSDFKSSIGLVLIRTTTLIISFIANRLKLSIHKDFPISKIYYVAYIVVLFGSLYLFVNSVNNQNNNIFNIFISSVILFSVNLVIILLDEKIYTSIMQNNEKYILKQQNTAYENQVNIINQSVATIKSLKHDIKNHLIVLNKLYETNNMAEIQEYTNKIIEQFDDKNQLSKSNNFIFDSIINFKLSSLQEDIDIMLDINIPYTINILAYDVTIVLGNLLDNAITASLNSIEKKLVLCISCSMGCLIIFIENSFNGELIEENDTYKTTKPYNSTHGLGIENVKKVLINYNGELRIEHTSNIFKVTAIMPY